MNQARARLTTPHEHRRRGLLAATLAVPIAAIVWASLQYASSMSAVLVGLLGGAMAVCFFRLGSGGVVSRRAVPRILVVATASAAVAVAGVFAAQMTVAWAATTGKSWFAAAGDPVFWNGSAAVVAQSSTAVDLLVASVTATVTCAALLISHARSGNSPRHILELLSRPTGSR